MALARVVPHDCPVIVPFLVLPWCTPSASVDLLPYMYSNTPDVKLALTCT